MLGIDKVLALMFRCCGISPSGSYIDKYFSITAVIIIITYPLDRIISGHIANGNTEGFVLTLLIVLSAIGNTFLIVSNWIEPDRYMNIMNDLESIGNQLPSHNDKRIFKITCLVFLILTLNLFAVFCQNGFYYAIILMITIIVINASSLQHIDMVERTKNRFSALNDLISNVAADTPMASTELDNLFHLHSSLQALVVDVDIHFCFVNLFNYVSKFIFCVFEMYEYLQTIENASERLQLTIFISFFMRVVLFISQALVCHACSQEANRTVFLAHRVLKPESPLELWEKVGLFSALAVDNKVHFTVGGIFTLDRALITQTALTAISYLIIAIQLRGIQLF